MLTVLDVFLFLIGAAFLAWGVYRQSFGMAITWFGFYISVILGGLVALFIAGANDFGMTIVGWLGGSARSISLVELAFFSATFLGSFVIYHLLFALAFKGEAYPSFGLIDGILGGVMGLVLSVFFGAVFVNVWRLLASVAWQPENLRQSMYAAYHASMLRVYLLPVLRTFNQFLPFSLTNPPLPLSPWG